MLFSYVFFLLLLFLLCLFVFSLLQRVGLRFSVNLLFEKLKGNASYARNNFTSPFFPLSLLQGRRSCVAIIPVAFSVIKATTVLSRIARTLDSIISNMKIFQCILNIDACCLSKRALKAETEIYISYW